jgi:hypothetical protein
MAVIPPTGMAELTDDDTDLMFKYVNLEYLQTSSNASDYIGTKMSRKCSNSNGWYKLR